MEFSTYYITAALGERFHTICHLGKPYRHTSIGGSVREFGSSSTLHYAPECESKKNVNQNQQQASLILSQ
jgi:hypothetical protein